MNVKFSLSEIAFILQYAYAGYSCYKNYPYLKEPRSKFQYIECIIKHLQDNLEDFINENTNDEYTEVRDFLRKIRENVDDKFWEEVKKEYKNSLLVHLAILISDGLANSFNNGWMIIADDIDLTNNGKMYLLREYKDTLEELRYAVVKALMTQDPLSSDELRKYLLRFLKLYKIAGINYDYPDELMVYLNYYDRDIDKAWKLKVLDKLLSDIDNELYFANCTLSCKVKKDLKESKELLQ